MILEASGVDPDAVTGCCLVACEVERFVYFLRLHDIEISIHHYSYQANALSVPDNFMGISFQYVITLFWDECSVLVLVIFFEIQQFQTKTTAVVGWLVSSLWDDGPNCYNCYIDIH